jgi:ubiquinone/menaquinone biosynthesis C-methylase UbiE/predicted RNA binding protein YcfA (HicA-like mRNA interferase family)
VTSIAERYDRNAELYERWWAPVLAPAAARLLERAEPWIRTSLREAGTLHIVDIGTGTGALAIEAVARWPAVTVTGVDVAAGMLEVAARRASRLLSPAQADRIRWLEADADRSPLPDGSADLCISSFVLQLVPDRPAALREALRILRPGGRLCFVTWQAGRDAFEPADEFDEAVYDLELEEPEYEEEARAGDLRSPRTAARELRAAGFQLKRQKGSHRTYKHPAVPGVLTIQPNGKDAEPYQVDAFIAMVAANGLELDS